MATLAAAIPTPAGATASSAADFGWLPRERLVRWPARFDPISRALKIPGLEIPPTLFSAPIAPSLLNNGYVKSINGDEVKH